MTSPELLTTEEMRQADRLAIAGGVAGIELMENAGAAVAATAVDFAAPGERVAVFCGPGANGGDGFVAARLLRERGFAVELALLGDPTALSGDAAEAARRWGGPIATASGIDLADVHLAIDALFGAGLSRDLDGDARDLVERLNHWSRREDRPILAVDVPSGVDGDSGAIRGVSIEARATVTFFRFKPGHLLLPGRLLCGEPHLAQIGIPNSVLEHLKPQTFANAPTLWKRQLPRPRVDGHKYTRGHALVLSGPVVSTGAGRLSARGALRAGAGLVTLASPRGALRVNAAHLTAIMLTPCDSPGDLVAILEDPRVNAIVMGPGLGVGEATAALVRAALESKSQLESKSEERGIVLDADALTSFAGRAAELAAAIRASEKAVILTPHEGEFSRLFKEVSSFVESIPEQAESISPRVESVPVTARPMSKLDRARAAAAAIGATIVLKGPDTIVAHPDGRASIGFDLPPWLATAGSGDVLAGIIGGLLAQEMPAFEAASAAVWMHGAAARAFGPGLIAEDIPESLPAVWRLLLDDPT